MGTAQRRCAAARKRDVRIDGSASPERAGSLIVSGVDSMRLPRTTKDGEELSHAFIRVLLRVIPRDIAR